MPRGRCHGSGVFELNGSWMMRCWYSLTIPVICCQWLHCECWRGQGPVLKPHLRTFEKNKDLYEKNTPLRTLPSHCFMGPQPICFFPNFGYRIFSPCGISPDGKPKEHHPDFFFGDKANGSGMGDLVRGVWLSPLTYQPLPGLIFGLSSPVQVQVHLLSVGT